MVLTEFVALLNARAVSSAGKALGVRPREDAGSIPVRRAGMKATKPGKACRFLWSAE